MKADGESEDIINDVLKSQKKLLSLILEGAKETEIESILVDITKKSMNIKSNDENAGKEDLGNKIKSQVACQLTISNID